MLPLRFTVVGVVFGLALWGLFSLLENLGTPELLRSTKAVIVKGCDPIESEDAARLCPQLFCQKFLLESKAVARKARFEVTVDRREGTGQLIGGIARSDPSAPGQSFACLLESGKVAGGRIVETAQLEELAAQPGFWTFEEP